MTRQTTALTLAVLFLTGCATCQTPQHEAPYAPAAYIQTHPTTREPSLAFWDTRQDGMENEPLYTERQVIEMLNNAKEQAK